MIRKSIQEQNERLQIKGVAEYSESHFVSPEALKGSWTVAIPKYTLIVKDDELFFRLPTNDDVNDISNIPFIYGNKLLYPKSEYLTQGRFHVHKRLLDKVASRMPNLIGAKTLFRNANFSPENVMNMFLRCGGYIKTLKVA